MTRPSPIRLRRAVQWGLVALVALMPLHALLSVWAGSLFGHQALWQTWKELLLVALSGVAIWLVYRERALLQRLQNPTVYAIGGLIVLGILVSSLVRPSAIAALFGLKTDYEFLVAYLVAVVVADRWLVQRAVTALLVSSGVVILFGLAQVYLLPKDILTIFGYGPATIQPFLLVDPALPDVRILSTLGGPNQLGSFLLIPLGVVMALLLRRPKWWQPLYLLAGMVVLWHSHSRSAWIGMAITLAVTIVALLPRRWRLPSLLAMVVAAAVVVELAIMGLGTGGKLQYYLLHSSLKDNGIEASTSLHGEALQKGVAIINKHPLGLGLGSAGPASYYGPRPIIPESYWLQIGIELGVVGLALFAAINLLVALRLIVATRRRPVAAGLLGALCGMAAINLFLHGWADSSTALVFWTLAGAMVGDLV